MKIKAFTLIFYIFYISVIGQTKHELEVKEFFWGENDNYKNSTKIPDKWKNESAVIIYKNVNYDYHKFGKKVTYKESIRKRIKLLDKAAVEEFSEFSFKKRFRVPKFLWLRRDENFVAIKIIKPDGREIIIDVYKEAIEVDGESKIAIANLEVGDIIDYYFYKMEPFTLNYAYGFDEVETNLGEEYPIVDFKLFFETENDFFINFNTYNGAPELKEIPTKKNNFRRYELVANNIEKNDFPRWYYPLLELPSYKFQVYFARSGKFENKAMAFLPEKEKIIKKTVTKEEVLDLYDKRFKPDGDIGDLKKFFKEKTFKNDTDKVTAAYYYMRHYYMTRFVEAVYIEKADIAYSFGYYDYDAVYIDSQKQFVKIFTEFLKRHKIKYEIVVAKKRFDGGIEDLLIENNVNVLLKISTEKPIYAEFFGLHTNINEFSPYIEGTNVYLLTASKNRIDGVKNGSLPISTSQQNETRKEMSLEIENDFSNISISSISNYKGYAKKSEQYALLQLSDYVYEDYEKYGTKSFLERVKKKKHKLKYTKEFNALKEKLKEKQKEKFKKNAEIEFDLNDIQDYNFKINNTGRYSFDSYFTFTETFKVKNALIKKAGPNYIIEVGKLIGGQIDLNEKERRRTENVYMKYSRIFNYEIKMNIPEGYSVSGLEKLKKNIDNVTGSFISDAKIVNNTLIINTSKQYKHNYEPNSNWNLMIDFLDEAYQFTNEKILLKKK